MNYKIHYAKKYLAMGAKYEGHYCILIKYSRNGNCLVKIFETGEVAIIPRGNFIYNKQADNGRDYVPRKITG